MISPVHALWLCALLAACSQPPGEVETLLVQEHTIQHTGTGPELAFSANDTSPLQLTLVPFEAVVEARVVSDQRGPVLHALVDYRRGVPLFLLIQPVENGETFTLHTTIRATTSQSTMAIQLDRLPANDGADQRRIEAFALYSGAAQAQPRLDEALWAQREADFRAAAGAFAGLGLIRQAHWAELLALAVAWFPFSRVDMVLSDAPDLAERALAAGQANIAVLATQIQGQALMFRQEDEDEVASRQSLERALTVFAQAALLAEDHGFGFQRAWAWNNRGIAHHYLGDYERAIEAYRQAGEWGVSLDDRYLDNVLRSNQAAAHERRGETAQAEALLQDVVVSQREAGALMELSFSLDRLGDVYARRYRFTEAMAAYTEAIALAEQRADEELQGYAMLSLGQAQFELGDMTGALASIEQAIGHLQSQDAGTGLGPAHATAANIYRFLGDAANSERHRALQALHLHTDEQWARFLLERGKDTLRLNPASPRASDARQDFESAAARARTADLPDLVALAGLYACLAEGTDDCDDPAMEHQVQRLLDSGQPGLAAESAAAWSELLQNQGKPAEALRVMDRAAQTLAVLRQQLAGVSGAWFWQRRSDLLRRLVDLQVAEDLEQGGGAQSLFLLDRLRHASLFPSPDLAGQPVADVDAEHQLEALRNSLPPDSAVFTWHFSGESVFAWRLDATGLTLTRLPSGAGLDERLREARDQLRVTGHPALDSTLAAAGAALFPTDDRGLPATLMVLGGGPLNGFPVDALRVDGAHLAERHTVIQLQSLDRAGAGLGRTGWRPESLLLAGLPERPATALASLAGAEKELQVIKALFSGATITERTGDDFVPESLDAALLERADLVHVASHASLDLAQPERSRIETSLSPVTGADHLTPADIANWQLSAQLVVLSACETAGSNAFRFDGNLGFVSELLDAGAGAVLATLRPVPDTVTAEFMERFYTSIEAGQGIAAAMDTAKRSLIGRQPVNTWSAFQLVGR